MKLTSKENPEGVAVSKYAMPTKGTAGTAKINGEDVVTMVTTGRGNTYTYFRIKNVDLYVSGTLDPATDYELDLPENFGSDTEPAARKSYYVRKRPAKNADGSVPAGSSDADGAPHTEVRDGVEVAVNPDGSLVSEEAQAQALEEGNDGGLKSKGANEEDVANGQATSGQEEAVNGGEETNPDGSSIDQAPTEPARRSRRK